MWVEKLPSGRVRGAFRLPNGAKRTRTFDYAYEAEAWAAEAETRACRAADLDGYPPAKGGHTDPPPVAPPGRKIPTVGTHGKAWLDRRHGTLTAATVAFYATQVRAIAATPLGRMRVNEPRRSHVEQWLTDQVRADVGRPTINARLKVLRMILRDALADGLTDRDPTVGIKPLPTDIRAERVLSGVEESRLLLAATPDLEAMVLLGLDAGLRWEEAAAVGVDCFLGDFLIVRQVVDRTTRTIRAYPKGHRSRAVPLTTRLVAALEPLMAAARADRGSSGLLFTNSPGGALDYWNWRRDQWRRACMDADLDPRPRFHDLRHTYGSRLAGKGVPRHEIAALMGHADEATTARYIHAGLDGHRLQLVRQALGGA